MWYICVWEMTTELHLRQHDILSAHSGLTLRKRTGPGPEEWLSLLSPPSSSSSSPQHNCCLEEDRLHTCKSRKTREHSNRTALLVECSTMSLSVATHWKKARPNTSCLKTTIDTSLRTNLNHPPQSKLRAFSLRQKRLLQSVLTPVQMNTRLSSRSWRT